MDNTSFAPGNNSINNSAPPPTPQYSVPEPKHFLNKKFIITFVVLILLGVGAYAGIWRWQNKQLAQETDPTADWKTYTNTEYGFNIHIPATWSVKDVNSSLVFYSDTQGTESSVQFGFFPKSQKSTIIGSTREEKIGDVNFTIYQSGGAYDNYDNFETIKDSRFYVFQFKDGYEKKPAYQILSTFKFIDSTDTSTWKTYMNTEYGFEVKYPTDYRVNPYGYATGGTAVRFVQTGPEATDLPNFSIWIFKSSLSPEAWLKTTTADAVVGDLTYHHISSYIIGQRTIVDAAPIELGTHARVFSEGGRIVVFADVSGIIDPVPLAIQSFKFID